MSLSLALLALLQVVQPPTPTDAQTSPPTVNQSAPTPAVASATIATAARAIKRPVIDGKDDDEVWREAQPITAFRQFSPVANGEPRFKTEAKVAYDDENFYVFIRMYDPHPDSIMRLLGRRDVRVATDQIKIIIDSYHDRRTGYEFAVNPAGVQRDYAVYNDITEDPSWDGVWEAKTTVDSLGWTAEFRIPLSQLRYAECEVAHIRLRRLARHRSLQGARQLAGVQAVDARIHVAARHRRKDQRHLRRRAGSRLRRTS